MLPGMSKESHSQPGHPLPAVDSIEGKRNGKKVSDSQKTEMQKAYQEPFTPAKINSAI